MGQRNSSHIKIFRRNKLPCQYNRNNSAKVIILNSDEEIDWDSESVYAKICKKLETPRNRCNASVQFDGFIVEKTEKETDTNDDQLDSNELTSISTMTDTPDTINLPSIVDHSKLDDAEKIYLLNKLSSPDEVDSNEKNISNDSGCYCDSPNVNQCVKGNDQFSEEKNVDYLSGNSEEDFSLREFEFMEKLQNEERDQLSCSKKPLVSPRRKRIKMVHSIDQFRSPQDPNGKWEYDFWIPCSTLSIRAFKDVNDRRIESISRMSGCNIQLTLKKRRNIVGDLQQLVHITAPSKKSLEKCWNLFNEKFPSFCSGTRRVTRT